MIIERVKVKKDDLIKKLNNLSFTAAMNIRYHQYKWTKYSYIDKSIRIAVGIVAVLSVVASSMGSSDIKNILIANLSFLLSILSLIVAIVLNIAPVSDRETFHRDLFRRWSDLREEVDSEIVRVESLDISGNEEGLNKFMNRLEDLTRKKNRINAFEDSPDDELLKKCYRQENKARTGFETQGEKDAYDAKKASSVV